MSFNKGTFLFQDLFMFIHYSLRFACGHLSYVLGIFSPYLSSWNGTNLKQKAK